MSDKKDDKGNVIAFPGKPLLPNPNCKDDFNFFVTTEVKYFINPKTTVIHMNIDALPQEISTTELMSIFNRLALNWELAKEAATTGTIFTPNDSKPYPDNEE